MVFYKKHFSKIADLNDLVEALYRREFYSATVLASTFHFTPEDFVPYTFWNSNHYTRNCIARNNDFELILLCWEPGQKTAIHCHNGQECWVKVIEGQFEEEVYEYNYDNGELEQKKGCILGKHEVTSVEDPSIFHTLKNTHTGRSMSLHLYTNPITQCRYYSAQDKCLQTVSLTYHSLRGELV